MGGIHLCEYKLQTVNVSFDIGLVVIKMHRATHAAIASPDDHALTLQSRTDLACPWMLKGHDTRSTLRRQVE